MSTESLSAAYARHTLIECTIYEENTLTMTLNLYITIPLTDRPYFWDPSVYMRNRYMNKDPLRKILVMLPYVDSLAKLCEIRFNSHN